MDCRAVGGLFGHGFAIVLVVSQFLAGTPLVVQGILGGVLIVLLLSFLASFAGMYREAGQNRLATIMYGSGVAVIAIAAVGDAPSVAVTQLRGTIDPVTVHALYGVRVFFYLKPLWPAAALALACTLATHRSHLLPEWYRLLTRCCSAVFVLGALSIRMDGFFSPSGAMGWIAMLTLAGWICVSSRLTMQRHEVAHTLPHAAMSH